MKICIPTKTKEGLKSKVCDHFGSALFFTIYDTDSNGIEVLDNSNQHHVHGSCHPLSVLNGQEIDAVVCRGMGLRAINSLNQGGIKAFRAVASTVEEIANKYRNGELEEMTPDIACQDHDCH
ncbi:NifB/NifX family molybdenum-iron cluster-binding protein [Candidatus Omnitrophota bacterium]